MTCMCTHVCQFQLGKKLEDFIHFNLIRSNLDYIKEHLVKEDKFCRKQIEKIKIEQQNLKELLEKLSQKVDQILEQLVKETSKLEENKIENIFQQFEKLSLGEKPKSIVEFKINPFEPRNLEIKPWKL